MPANTVISTLIADAHPLTLDRAREETGVYVDSLCTKAADVVIEIVTRSRMVSPSFVDENDPGLAEADALQKQAIGVLLGAGVAEAEAEEWVELAINASVHGG